MHESMLLLLNKLIIKIFFLTEECRFCNLGRDNKLFIKWRYFKGNRSYFVNYLNQALASGQVYGYFHTRKFCSLFQGNNLRPAHTTSHSWKISMKSSFFKGQ